MMYFERDVEHTAARKMIQLKITNNNNYETHGNTCRTTNIRKQNKTKNPNEPVKSQVL